MLATVQSCSACRCCSRPSAALGGGKARVLPGYSSPCSSARRRLAEVGWLWQLQGGRVAEATPTEAMGQDGRVV